MQRLGNVLEFCVSQFVGQHRFHFISVQLLEQSIKKHHTLLFAKASEEGI
jgi:hypothetical protein